MSSNHPRSKTPWPTGDAMKQIYAKNLWGGERGSYYSGSGSHDPKIVKDYIEVVRTVLSSFTDLPVVLDLGCGDFNVGRQLVPLAKEYIAADIVPELIDRNRKRFEADHLRFICLDISEDDWPGADVVILRQVLQHLSNKEIDRIVSKLGSYSCIILTEHVPEGEFEPNKDIISGQGIRLKKGSGVDLTAPPFGIRFKKDQILLQQRSEKWGGVIVTRTCSI